MSQQTVEDFTISSPPHINHGRIGRYNMYVIMVVLVEKTPEGRRSTGSPMPVCVRPSIFLEETFHRFRRWKKS